MYNLRKDGLTSISSIATPSLEDKFLLTIVSLGINSFAMGPSLWKGENTWKISSCRLDQWKGKNIWQKSKRGKNWKTLHRVAHSHFGTECLSSSSHPTIAYLSLHRRSKKPWSKKEISSCRTRTRQTEKMKRDQIKRRHFGFFVNPQTQGRLVSLSKLVRVCANSDESTLFSILLLI